MIRVIVFSDIRIYCEGLTRVLSSIESIRVVGSESHFQDAIKKIKRVTPDVILLDMTMAGSCLIAQKVMQFFPQARIVALAAPEDEKNIIRCAEAGIVGYVAREASLDDLIEALKGAQSGEICYPPRIALTIFNKFRQVAQQMRGNATAPILKQNDQLIKSLTNREIQIARLMSDGMSNKQISRTLSIEVSTVKNHVHNILVKLDVSSRVQVVSLLQRSAHATGSRSFDLGMTV